MDNKPPKTALLGQLVTIISYEGDDVIVPLHVLCGGNLHYRKSKNRIANLNTPYQSLAYKGKRLIPEIYKSRYQSQYKRMCGRIRLFNVFSQSEQTIFLEKHTNMIDNIIFNPEKIFRIKERDRLQVESLCTYFYPLQEEDIKFMINIFSSFHEQLCNKNEDYNALNKIAFCCHM
jgi:hypothetical protein